MKGQKGLLRALGAKAAEKPFAGWPHFPAQLETVLVLVKPELPRHTDSRTHVPRAAPRGIVKPESQGSGRAWFRLGCLTGFSNFTPE